MESFLGDFRGELSLFVLSIPVPPKVVTVLAVTLPDPLLVDLPLGVKFPEGLTCSGAGFSRLLALSLPGALAVAGFPCCFASLFERDLVPPCIFCWLAESCSVCTTICCSTVATRSETEWGELLSDVVRRPDILAARLSASATA